MIGNRSCVETCLTVPIHSLFWYRKGVLSHSFECHKVVEEPGRNKKIIELVVNLLSYGPFANALTTVHNSHREAVTDAWALLKAQTEKFEVTSREENLCYVDQSNHVKEHEPRKNLGAPFAPHFDMRASFGMLGPVISDLIAAIAAVSASMEHHFANSFRVWPPQWRSVELAAFGVWISAILDIMATIAEVSRSGGIVITIILWAEALMLFRGIVSAWNSELCYFRSNCGNHGMRQDLIWITFCFDLSWNAPLYWLILRGN